MRANTDRIAGVQLVTDPVGRRPVAPAPDVALDGDDFIPAGLSVLATRSASGLDVQLLIDAESNTYVTAILNGEIQTVEVPRAKAMDAFHHPFVFGITLPL